jgi:histone deacetylase 6
MEGDEDTMMGGTGSRAIPIGSGRPSSISPVKPREVSLGVNGGRAASISPAAFDQSHKTPAPLPSTHIHQTNENSTPSPGVAAQLKTEQDNSEDKVSSDNEISDSIMEEGSDFEDDDFTVMQGLPISSRDTGLCYDVRMRYHCEVRPTADVHPEDPRRIHYIYKELCRAGLFDDPEHSSGPLVSHPMKRIKIRDATKEEICLVHTPDHYDFVESTQCTYPSFYFQRGIKRKEIWRC